MVIQRPSFAGISLGRIRGTRANLVDRFRCAAALMMLLIPPHSASPADLVRLRFREVDTLFANPGQGWMSWRDSLRAESRFPCSVAYIRFNWADLEPEQGRYNWKPIDGMIEDWKSRGVAIAMRVMTCNSHSGGYYASPKWLFDAGCNGYEYRPKADDMTAGGDAITRIEPDYADPIYLESQGAFIRALGERYDGNPDVEFLDIGSYGNWGEWHTPHPAPLAARRRIIDFYLQAFRKTPLAFMSDDAEAMDYALGHGAGLRRDGVGCPWHGQNWIGSGKYAGVTGMADAWKHAPIVFEWYGSYDYLQSRNWSFDAAVEFMLNNHVTLINDNVGHVPPGAMPQLEKLARLAGARFVLRELAHERIARRGSTLDLEMTWANVGVGKLYRPYVLRLFLLGANGVPVLTSDARADPRSWLPGEYKFTESLSIPTKLKVGEYTLAVALVAASGQSPPFRLAIEAPEKDARYEVGEVEVE